MSERILKIVNYTLLSICAIMAIIFYVELNGNTDSFTSTIMYWCYILLVIGIVLAIVFPIIQMAKNPKKAKNALIGIALLVIVFAISYAIADAKVLPSYAKMASPSVAKWVSGGIICFYIMAVLSIAAVIYAEVSKLFK